MYSFILNIISQINPEQKLYEYQVSYSDILLSLFLPTARSAVGLGITYSHFYSFYHDNLAILTFCHFAILTF
jgi:hypothetical protein